MKIHKKLVTDEQMRPIAVQIDYEDWLMIEQELALETGLPYSNFHCHRGVINLSEDSLAYQERLRSEWP